MNQKAKSRIKFSTSSNNRADPGKKMQKTSAVRNTRQSATWFGEICFTKYTTKGFGWMWLPKPATYTVSRELLMCLKTDKLQVLKTLMM